MPPNYAAVDGIPANDVPTQASARGNARNRATWDKLPKRMKAEEHKFFEDESLANIIKVRGLYFGDFASAQAIRLNMIASGAMRWERDEAGQLWLIKADKFPDPPTVAEFMAAEQAVVDAVHQRDIKLIKEEEDARERNAQFYRTTDAGAIAEFIRQEIAKQLPGIVREAVAEAMREAPSEHTDHSTPEHTEHNEPEEGAERKSRRLAFLR